MNIFKFLHSTYRLGRPKLKKPHILTVFIGDTIIDLKFTREDYDKDLMWDMYRVVIREMRLNLKHQKQDALSEDGGEK